MYRLPVALSLLVLSISACAKTPAPAAPATKAPTAATAPAPKSSDSPTSQTTESQEATASQESTGEETADDKRDASLERLAAMPASQQLPSGQWKPGVHYTPLVPAQPTSVPAGKTEVVEVFWYGCPHCAALEPFVTSWLKNKPEYVEFVRVPVMWGPAHRVHAHLYYTLEALKRDDLHDVVFDTIHKQGQNLLGTDEASSKKLMVDFATQHDITADAFNKAWDSFGVNSNLQRAEQMTQRYHVDGVPLFVINGKYTTDVGKAGGAGQTFSLINDLAASEAPLSAC